MTKDEFYIQVKKWEKNSNKYSIIFAIYLFIAFSLANQINKYFPFEIQSTLEAVLIVIGISIPAIIFYERAFYSAKRFNLICNNCKLSFENYKHLTHIGFTNKCPKCGNHVCNV